MDDGLQSSLLYVVRARLRDEADLDGWNAWYDNTHVPDLLRVPGLRRAERFQHRSDDRCYLALYDIDSAEVFELEQYKRIEGWGPWATSIAWNTRVIYRVESTLQRHGGSDRSPGAP